MGLFFRPRRPLARIAASAATAGVAYHYGTKHVLQEQYDQEAAAAYQATPYAPQYVPPPEAHAASAAAVGPTRSATSDLDHLVALHGSGVLNDEEFSAAKAKLLGI